MNYRIYDIGKPVTESEVTPLLNQLQSIGSDWRCEQALRFKHPFGQFACLKSYQMLVELSGHNAPFLYNEYGKPYWPDGPFFSISHCLQAILVAVDDAPIGADIETFRHFNRDLVERTMNAAEQAHILSHEQPDKAFVELWTKKEAYLKYLGTGIVEDLHQVLVSVPKERKFVTEIETRYVYTIVT